MIKQILNDEGVPSKNQKQLESFAEYCLKYPQERFWQALRNWSGYNFILGANGLDLNTGQFTGIEDTFYLDK